MNIQLLRDGLSSLRTMQRREEFMRGTADPTTYFTAQYARIRAAGEIVPKFVNDPFVQNDFFVSKSTYEDGQQRIRKYLDELAGKSVRINNLDEITHRLAQKTALVFDPITTYYTPDPSSRKFREEIRLLSA